MKPELLNHSVDQPEPFTPGLTKIMVREHALKVCRDKLRLEGYLTLKDWVLAEKDLVSTMETEEPFTR